MKQKLPKGCRWCNACGGVFDGFEDKSCEVCKGKGYWNAKDIEAYHIKYPSVCRASCGKAHRDPDLRSSKELDAALDRAIKLLESWDKDTATRVRTLLKKAKHEI
jgi:hypothetical protein